MKQSSKWWDLSWNPTSGCTPVSAGCANCWARRMHERWYGPGSFDRVIFHEEKIEIPAGTGKRVFVCNMGDIFHNDVKPEWLADIFNIMCSYRIKCRIKGEMHEHEPECFHNPNHIYFLLTKRPKNIQKKLDEMYWHLDSYWPGDAAIQLTREVSCWPPKNIWLGVSVEDQVTANDRIPELLKIGGFKKFISYEPALGPVDFGIDVRRGVGELALETGEIKWVIAGCESGPGRRPAETDWFRSVRGQCQKAGVPFFLKQRDIGGKLVHMPELDGKIWDQKPEAGE